MTSLLALPQFNHIAVHKIQPALSQILAENLKILDQDALIDPIGILEKLENRLQLFWSPIAHLHAVKSAPALRKAYQACLPLLSDYQTKISHHTRLYQAFCDLKSISQTQHQYQYQSRIIDLTLRDFYLSGIKLLPDQKIRYAAIEKQLSQLQSTFGENVLDASQAFEYQAQPHELAGIPESLIPKNNILTLNPSVYAGVMKYADNQALREKFYHAYVTRASEYGHAKHDNTGIMQQILLLRHELAELLGFKTYADLSLETKMAKNSQQVLDFLNNLVSYAKPAAQKELQSLADFAGIPLSDIKPWDIAYYSEKFSQKLYGIHQEMFRPYFQIEHVLSGLFCLVNKLYSITIKQRIPDNDQTQVWDKHVSCYEIYDQTGLLIGIFYLDLYARKNKRDGAWMDDYCSRYQPTDGALQIPVAYLTCNFLKPKNISKPAFLTHDDVITVFHEFGHGLHHLLTRIDRLDISGINNVAWDAVELPSQFMENFCWQKEVLAVISNHTLPEDLAEKLLRSRHFQLGLQLIRQLEFSLFDFELHLAKPELNNKNFIMTIFNQIHARVSVINTPEYYRFPHAFCHIFDGGYAAAYYSYLWAEVLACDVFSVFEKNPILDKNKNTGQRFLDELLSQGGAQDPEVLFKNFMGRAPDHSAFLKSWGLLK